MAKMEFSAGSVVSTMNLIPNQTTWIPNVFSIALTADYRVYIDSEHQRTTPVPTSIINCRPYLYRPLRLGRYMIPET